MDHDAELDAILEQVEAAGGQSLEGWLDEIEDDLTEGDPR